MENKIRSIKRPKSLSSKRLDFNDELELTKKWSLRFDIEHLHGPEVVERGPEELVVVCMVRDGRPFIGSFIEHYRALGAKHLVFLDNGSADGTVEALKEYDNVTVLRTGLPYVEYHFVMKRYLIERFGRDRWTLCVDIDELFDYPYSDVVDLRSFLGYLSENGYTAVVSQMLDMFPEEPLREGSGEASEDEPLKEKHRFYDISNVAQGKYTPPPQSSADDNVISNPGIEIFRGGIKKTLFGYLPNLTKHPLIFFDGKTKPFDNSSHWASGARVADLTCVLSHYTFLEFLYKRLRRDLGEGNYFSESKFRGLSRALSDDSRLQIKLKTARELENVNDLVDNGFLLISGRYLARVGELERSNGVAAEERSLIGAFSAVDARARGGAGRVRSLERQTRRLRKELRTERERASELESTNRSLEEQLRDTSSSRGRRFPTSLGFAREKIKSVLGRIRASLR